MKFIMKEIIKLNFNIVEPNIPGQMEEPMMENGFRDILMEKEYLHLQMD